MGSQGFVNFIAKCLKKKPTMRLEANKLFEDEWIQAVNDRNRTELLPWIGVAIPLLQKERELAAFMANQENSDDEEDDDEPTESQTNYTNKHGQTDSVQSLDVPVERNHQPTGTFVLSADDLQSSHQISGTTILNLSDIPSQYEIDDAQFVMNGTAKDANENDLENTEIEHGDSSSSSSEENMI